MTLLDWVVLAGTTLFIVFWGLWRTKVSTSENFFRGDYALKWPTIGLSVMATQASAITFLSVPGQAYEDGLRFIQFYFGMPLAMVVISAVFIPIYYRLKLVTAYQYLEARFDLKTRLFGAFLFLIQRGLASGITLYAPAIILSAVLGWQLELTILVIGVVVIVYTVTGGSNAVSQTQKQQMVVMMGGMVVAGIVILWRLPPEVSVGEAMNIAGAFGRINPVSVSFDFEDRYNLWSGLAGGFFLALSYFGTDQSQVGRYLAGKSIAESRLGLLFNGVLKIPMQLLILGVGILVFVFYQFTPPPLLFNAALEAKVRASSQAAALLEIETRWVALQAEKKTQVEAFLAAERANDAPTADGLRASLKASALKANALRTEVKAVVAKAVPGAEVKDSDYIFITFVKRWLPSGLFGLLIAVILAAAMSSIASELTALGATTTVDFYRRVFKREATEKHALMASKGFTILWGVVAICFATFASLLDNLIQAVNILGSIFYGTVLGLFLVAFFVKRVQGNAVFVAGVLSQGTVLALFAFTKIGYLWFNVIGCTLVVTLGLLLQRVLPTNAANRPLPQ